MSCLLYTSRFLLASNKAAPLRGVKSADPARLEALVRSIKESFEEYLTLSSRMPKDVAYRIVTSLSLIHI